MPRVLEPGQIEALGQRAAPRIRLPERHGPFASRAQRLRELAHDGAPGQAIGDYLRLMAAVADVQEQLLETFEAPLPDTTQLERSQLHHMPPLAAAGWQPAGAWRELVQRLCSAVAASADVPDAARQTLGGLLAAPERELAPKLERVLGASHETVDIAAAPFLMAALQVRWVALASQLTPDDVPALEVPSVCPLCGTPPLASIVRTDERSQGHRYLHCALCATEWHMVRIKCSHCLSTEGIAYHVIAGHPDVIRAESCDRCHCYRKILYQEKDPRVDAVADDLASLALDLLMADAGFQRASGNPLLWHAADVAPR